MNAGHLVVESILTEALTAVQRTAIVDLCSAAHDEDFGLLFFFLPHDGQHFLGLIDGVLVAHAVCTLRHFVVDGRIPLRAGYIDAVATMPGLQRRGYGSAVMRTAGEHIRTHYDIGGLSTSRPSFYRRLGWRRWRGFLAARTEQGLEPAAPRGEDVVMVLTSTSTPPLTLGEQLSVEWRPGVW
ncbi:MAG: GNAT family N-acetyltransferase [Anaerolineales bacterium]|nr:GNAT family N-acetyltransferase [Anaerolineales bacterium]